MAFDYRDELQVEWAGQPNWYFRISKFSLPYLHHPCVPTCVYLDEWFAGRGKGCRLIGRVAAEAACTRSRARGSSLTRRMRICGGFRRKEQLITCCRNVCASNR